MNEDDLDPRMAMLAAVTAVSHCDVIGYKDALARLPRIDLHGGGGTDPDTDVAIFNGSGVAS
jgi:hypothetical protein